MKILYITTISLTMNTFFKPHIEMLVGEGHQVDIACNSRDLALDELYSKLKCNFYQVDFSRSPLAFDNIRAYGQLKKVIKNGYYDAVHCHTPNAAAITRLVCRKLRKNNSLKVYYTAHGFHFYKGAPLLNWLIFYPVEKFCSYFTDTLITINREDFELAEKKFHAKHTEYIPGVGIDFSRFENVNVDRIGKRREIGVPEDGFLLFSVGELNDNKNHRVIIKAMAELNNPDIHYAIAGVGDRHNYLLLLAKELNLSEKLHLLGFRKDIAELDYCADVFCFPSFREGLPVSPIEAMACGLPVICSDIRGNSDLIDEKGGYLVKADDVKGFAAAIGKILTDEKTRESFSQRNIKEVRRFSQENVLRELKELFNYS